MINKPLIAGIVGFLAGGLLVSIAATTFDKPAASDKSEEVTMSAMTEMLKPLKGDDYDKAFIEHMIDHHQGAVSMAKLSAERANHKEIKDLSLAIIDAQETEIDQMRQWQSEWRFVTPSTGHDMHGM